jgi:hypothetical protein
MKTMQPIPLLLTEQPAPASPATLPLKDLGTTYSMAQAVPWLDERSFAIGRWDGTLTVFRCATGAPIVSEAIVAPSLTGVEIIARIKHRLFASSNDAKSLVVWRADAEFEAGIRLKGTLSYDEAFGVANDGTTTAADGVDYFVSGSRQPLSARVERRRRRRQLHLSPHTRRALPEPYPEPVPD